MSSMTVQALLQVALKGADLAATTAELTLRHRMGFDRVLLGLRRLDEFAFLVRTQADPQTTLEGLRAALDRQSTFYNRNKHRFAMRCDWRSEHASGCRIDGEDPEAMRARWVDALARRHGGGLEPAPSGGDAAAGVPAPPGRRPIVVDAGRGYLVEVLVEPLGGGSGPDVGVRLAAGLLREGVEAEVEVLRHGVRWWLALAAPDAAAARASAEAIAVTRSRTQGLLANPHAERVTISPPRAI